MCPLAAFAVLFAAIPRAFLANLPFGGNLAEASPYLFFGTVSVFVRYGVVSISKLSLLR